MKTTQLKFHHLIPFFLILIFSSNSKAVAPTSSNEILPIDQLEQNLKKNHKSKAAQFAKEAYQAYQKKQYAEAISLTNKFKKNDLFSDYSYWISYLTYQAMAKEDLEDESYKKALKNAQKALELILELEKKNPYSYFIKNTSKMIADSELVIGHAYWGLKQWKNSQNSFESAFQRLNNLNLLNHLTSAELEPYSASCKKKMGTYCHPWLQKLALNFKKRPSEFNTISENFPEIVKKTHQPVSFGKLTATYKAPDLDQAAFDNSMKLFLEDKYSQSIKAFAQFLDDFPKSSYRFRARFWLGQAFVREKENEKAQKIFEGLLRDSPLSYYGLLSANELNKTVDSVIDASLPLGSETDVVLQPHEIIHLQKAEKFIAEKAYELAALELKEIKIKDHHSNPFLIYVAMLSHKARAYPLCFLILNELIQRGYSGVSSTFGLRLIFPLEYIELIKKYSTQNELDPILVLSLIKQESAFDENAGSGVGAMGLMQIMPATALEVDAKVNIPDLLKAEQNIRLGTKYLKKLLNRFNGNIVFSLAGYNAGPTATDRWIKAASLNKGMLEFIETIPFKETREYVASIIRNYFWYTKQITGESKKSMNYFWNVYGPPEVSPQIPNNLKVKVNKF